MCPATCRSPWSSTAQTEWASRRKRSSPSRVSVLRRRRITSCPAHANVESAMETTKRITDLCAEHRLDAKQLAAKAGNVGLYFGYGTKPLEAGVDHYWCDLSFADRGMDTTRFPNPGRKADAPREFAQVTLFACHLTEPAHA